MRNNEKYILKINTKKLQITVKSPKNLKNHRKSRKILKSIKNKWKITGIFLTTWKKTRKYPNETWKL